MNIILIDFADGSTRLYDALPLLSRKYFEKLNALPFFMRAHASFDTVAWDDDIDIAPEHLYENSTPVSPA